MRSRLAAVFLVLCIPRLVGGQTIHGFVTDPDQARVPGATVTVIGLSPESTASVITADHGGYRVSALPAGTYEVRAELAGFATGIVRDVSIAPGETRQIDFVLALATYAEAVAVIGTAARDAVTTSEIRDSAARDIGEALSHLNGVTKIRKGGIANDIVLHGYKGKDLTVLIDGQPVHGACPNAMDPAVFHADFAEVDHIDIGKGPFDVFNQGSLGGVVNVVTKKPADGFHAESNVSAGSYGYVNPSGTMSYGSRTVSLLGGYSYRSSDPYRDGSGARFTEYANYRSELVDAQAFGAHTGWLHLFASPQRGHTIQVSYTRQQADHLLYPYLQMDAITDNADRLRIGYERTRADAGVKTFAADAYYTRVGHVMTDEFRTSAVGSPRPYSMITDAASSVAGGKMQIAFANITTGIEGLRRRWSAATSMAMSRFQPQYAIPDVTTDSVGAYATLSRALFETMQVTIGGRLDWSRSAADADHASTNLYFAYHGTRSTSASDLMPSGHVRLSRRLSEHMTIAGGIGHTERVPDPQERYYGLRRMGADWVGDPTLAPASNTGINVDVAYRHGRVAASASVYRDWLGDFIALAPQAKVNDAIGVMNARAQTYHSVNARMTSGEATVTYSLSSRLFATAKAASTRGVKDPSPSLGLTSDRLAEMPPLNGSLAVRYDRVTTFGEAEVVMATSQSRVDTDLGEQPTPGYSVMNLRVGRRIATWRVTFDVNNVFNRLYLDYLSYQRDPFRNTVRVREPGRNVYVNVSYRY
jgi:iron complex outermembrane recepter protein